MLSRSDWVPLSSVLGPALFKIFRNDVDENIARMLISFEGDSNLGGTANAFEDKIRTPY